MNGNEPKQWSDYISTNYQKLFPKEKASSFISTSLKGISQVILIENAITGLIILIAITTYSYILGAIALASTVIGTLIGKVASADEGIVNQGLFGYNSVLTGIAVASYLSGPYFWIIALLAASFTAILTGAMMHWMRNTEIPVLTFPYIILTWFVLLATYRFDVIQISPALVPQHLSLWELNIAGKTNWAEGIIKSIGQIFFLDHISASILLYVAVFWAGWKTALSALLGSIVAMLTASILGGEHSLIFNGLYGYNAILTILAVSLFYKQESNRFAFISGILAASLTAIFTASVDMWLLPYGLPALTMPFVLSTWIFLAARKVLPKL